jgi:hypothetical protein
VVVNMGTQYIYRSTAWMWRDRRGGMLQ